KLHVKKKNSLQPNRQTIPKLTMHIFGAWLLKDATSRRTTLPTSQVKPSVFMSGWCSLIPILRLPGHAFLAWTRISTLTAVTPLAPLGATQRNVLWKAHRNWSRTRPKLCSPRVIINTWCCVITDLPERPSVALAKCYQAAARYRRPWAQLPGARDTG